MREEIDSTIRPTQPPGLYFRKVIHPFLLMFLLSRIINARKGESIPATSNFYKVFYLLLYTRFKEFWFHDKN